MGESIPAQLMQPTKQHASYNISTFAWLRFKSRKFSLSQAASCWRSKVEAPTLACAIAISCAACAQLLLHSFSGFKIWLQHTLCSNTHTLFFDAQPVTRQDSRGRTPLALARELEAQEMITLLEKKEDEIRSIRIQVCARSVWLQSCPSSSMSTNARGRVSARMRASTQLTTRWGVPGGGETDQKQTQGPPPWCRLIRLFKQNHDRKTATAKLRPHE